MQNTHLFHTGETNECFFGLIDFEFIAAVLANAYGLIFNFCFACAFVLSDKQPKSAGANNKKCSSHFPKATIAFGTCFCVNLFTDNVYIIAAAFSYHYNILLS